VFHTIEFVGKASMFQARVKDEARIAGVLEPIDTGDCDAKVRVGLVRDCFLV